uniref:DUF1618 domain-containing protein n=1 Tax=Arundo donax TaxID=35708 RepID=A0A0A8Y2U9_ARUDO
MRRQRRSGGRTAARRRQHLYLVLDDWSWGHSIYKVDLSSGDSAEPPPDAFSGVRSEQFLPPVLVRLEGPPIFPEHVTAAFGTKIIAVPRKSHVATDARPSTTTTVIVPVFDVHTRRLTLGPEPMVDLDQPVYFPLGDRLFVLCSNSFQVMHSPSLQPPPDDGPSSPEGSWRELPKHPFDFHDVTCYAVHPDGRTIFVSTKSSCPNAAATYAFDTAETGFQWKKHGNWALPFTGHANFDPKLDAWVGLSGDRRTTGHICTCDVVSPESSDDDGRCPSWKVSKEKLFREENPMLGEDPDEETHFGATLVYMAGRRSKFCLVQSMKVYYDDSIEDEFRFVYRLTKLSLKYDKNGDLIIDNRRRVRYYRAEEACGYALIEPVAFWM